MNELLDSMGRRIGAESKSLDGIARELFPRNEARAKDLMEISKQLKEIHRSPLSLALRLGQKD